MLSSIPLNFGLKSWVVGTVVVSSSPDSVFIKSCDGSTKSFSGFVKSLKWNLNPRIESLFVGKYLSGNGHSNRWWWSTVILVDDSDL